MTMSDPRSRACHARRLPLLILLALTMLVAGLVPAASAADPVTPSAGIHFGAQVNLRYGLSQYESIERFEGQIGRPLAIVNRFRSFSDHDYRDERRHLADGRIPLISWRATDSALDPNRAQRIASGEFDGLIRDTARAIRDLGQPVLIRFAWEMTATRGQRQYIGEPAQFISAWRRIHDIFAQEGATNGLFVWAPRAAGFKKGTSQAYYPGDSYVDWIGASAVPTFSFRSFDTLFGGFYSWASTRNKPLLTWVGVRENPDDPSWKADFVTGAHTTLQQWPAVKAFVYYHAQSPKGYYYWADTSTAAFNRYRTMACDPLFRTQFGC